MIREITTYDGNTVRSRDPYDTRPYTEVKVGKLYECTECGSYFTKFEDHTQYCPSIKTKLESRSMA
jgi:hypothetical protein